MDGRIKVDIRLKPQKGSTPADREQIKIIKTMVDGEWRQRISDTLAEPIPSYVRLDKSKIPNAGWGIFAESFLPKGFRLGAYKGKWVEPGRYEDLPETSLYIWELRDYRGNKCRPHGTLLRDNAIIGYIDADNPAESSYHRFINHPRTLEEENLLAMQDRNQIIYVTKRDISAGEELYVNYGPDYSQYLLGRTL